jgi:curli biogenesis system outer membrane secretion channel CsgG
MAVGPTISLANSGQLANNGGMNTQDTREIARRYCDEVGIELSTLAVRVLNNSRFFERLERQRERNEKAEAKLLEYISANPPKTNAGAGT